MKTTHEIIDDYGDNVTQARLLPTGGGGNIICGKRGYEKEMSYRRERNKTLEDSAKFPLPSWDSLKIYGEE